MGTKIIIQGGKMLEIGKKKEAKTKRKEDLPLRRSFITYLWI